MADGMIEALSDYSIWGQWGFYCQCGAHMKIRELMIILGAMNPEAEAFVALFRADGTSDTFDIEDVSGNHGDAQIEISEEEPAA